MDNFHDLVDEDNNLVLKAFSSFCELADATDAENKLDSLPWLAQVYPGVSLREAFRDNISAKLTKASLEKGPNFVNG